MLRLAHHPVNLKIPPASLAPDLVAYLHTQITPDAIVTILKMFSFRFVLLLILLFSAGSSAAVDLNRTFTLLREGEQLSAATAADLESKVAKKPSDLENRLRLLSYYAGQQGADDVQKIRASRAAHVLWIIRNEPKAAVFDISTRVYAIQSSGGPLADAPQFQAAKEAWESQIAAQPRDNEIKRNAATFAEIGDPAKAESLLKSTGDDRWLGQVYAKAILGIVASDYRTSDPVLTSEDRRNSEFARHAREELEKSMNAAMLGGTGFTLCRDGGMLYADGKLDWDYTPLAKKLLNTAEQINPANMDVFSVVAELPKRGERPPITLRIGGAQLEKSVKKRVDPIRPPGAPPGREPVRLNLLIGLEGSVARAVAIGGPPALRDAAVAALKQWIFSPTSISGKAVYVISTIDLLF